MPDISQMLANVAELVPAITLLIQVIASVAGMLVVVEGLRKFHLVTKRGEATIGSAFSYIISGVALLNLALSINAAFDLLYGGTGVEVNHLMAYSPSGAMPEQGTILVKVIVMLLQVYGLFFTVTGWLTIRKLADNRQGSESTFKSAMFRIFGGAALINIVLTVNTFAGFLGFGQVL